MKLIPRHKKTTAAPVALNLGMCDTNCGHRANHRAVSASQEGVELRRVCEGHFIEGIVKRWWLDQSSVA